MLVNVDKTLFNHLKTTLFCYLKNREFGHTRPFGKDSVEMWCWLFFLCVCYCIDILVRNPISTCFAFPWYPMIHHISLRCCWNSLCHHMDGPQVKITHSERQALTQTISAHKRCPSVCASPLHQHPAVFCFCI